MSGRSLRRYVSMAVAVGLVLLLTVVVLQVSARERSVDGLAGRLMERGVPVKHASVVSQVPFRIEITLLSASQDDKLALGDAWFMQLARHEATMAYRLGMPIASYSLTVVNARGDALSAEQNFLYPTDRSQQLGDPAAASLDNAATERLLLDQLDFSGLTVDSLKVVSDPLSPQTDRFLEMELSVPDVEAANKVLAGFMVVLPRKLKAINTEHGTRIVLCHLRLLDREGGVLLDYVHDTETGEMQWHLGMGVTRDWFPHPPEPTPTS